MLVCHRSLLTLSRSVESPVVRIPLSIHEVEVNAPWRTVRLEMSLSTPWSGGDRPPGLPAAVISRGGHRGDTA